MSIRSLRVLFFLVLLSIGLMQGGCVSDDSSQPVTIDNGKESDQTDADTSSSPAETNTSSGPKVAEAPSCDSTQIGNSKVRGRLWIDPRKINDFSEYNLGQYSLAPVDPYSNDFKGVASKKVKLHLPGNETLEVDTCKEGWFAFNPPSKSIGLIEYPNNKCSTNNCPTHFASLAAKGSAKVVTIGEFFASTPSDTELPGVVRFPEKLKEIAAPIITIDNVNLADPNSHVEDWLPSRAKFADIPKADLFLISLGGKEAIEFLKSPDVQDIKKLKTLNEKLTKVLELNDSLDRVFGDLVTRVKKIIREIRQNNPDADIVWVSYPNFAEVKEIQKLVPPGKLRKFFVVETKRKIVSLNRELSGYENTMILDLTNYHDASGNSLNLQPLIHKKVSFNNDGHQFVAEEIFRILGGWVESYPNDAQRAIGYHESDK